MFHRYSILKTQLPLRRFSPKQMMPLWVNVPEHEFKKKNLAKQHLNKSKHNLIDFNKPPVGFSSQEISLYMHSVYFPVIF